MDSATAGLKTTDHDGVMRVDFIERNILDEANIQQIGDGLNKVVDASDHPRILICFENVEHLSSAALGALITVSNRVASKNGELRLSDINEQILEVFRITRLDQMFQIHTTAADAMASFS